MFLYFIVYHNEGPLDVNSGDKPSNKKVEDACFLSARVNDILPRRLCLDNKVTWCHFQTDNDTLWYRISSFRSVCESAFLDKLLCLWLQIELNGFVEYLWDTVVLWDICGIMCNKHKRFAGQQVRLSSVLFRSTRRVLSLCCKFEASVYRWHWSTSLYAT